MLWGGLWGLEWGNPSDFISLFEVDDLGSGCVITATSAVGYEGWFQPIVDNFYGPPIYIGSTSPTKVRVQYGPETIHYVGLAPQGDDSGTTFDNSYYKLAWEVGRAGSIAVSIPAAPALFSYGDNGQLTSWSLSNLLRSQTIQSPTTKSWGTMQCSLANASGTYTVTLSQNGQVLSTGFRVGNGTCILTGTISGSVSITYTSDVQAILVADYPEAYTLFWRQTPWTSGDFPRQAQATVYDDGISDVFYYTIITNLSGLWFIVVHGVSSEGVESTGYSNTEVSVSYPPNPAGIPIYISGNYSNTTIQYTASSTSGATYNIYDSGVGGQLYLDSPSQTHAAGTGILTTTLSSISSSFTGDRYVLVRAVNGGIEEGSMNTLTIPYISGVVTPLQPPIPTFRTVNTVGNQMVVTGVIDSTLQATAATNIHLYAWAVGSSPSWGTPQGTATVSPGGSIVYPFTVQATLSNGVYYVAVRTYSSITMEESSNTLYFGPAKVSTVAPADPATNITIGF